jgi:hypothetical protein
VLCPKGTFTLLLVCAFWRADVAPLALLNNPVTGGIFRQDEQDLQDAAEIISGLCILSILFILSKLCSENRRRLR